jgi:5'-methylthioadenosine phosphorylase
VQSVEERVRRMMKKWISIGTIGGGMLPVQWGLPYEQIELTTPYGSPSSPVAKTRVNETSTIYSVLRHGDKHALGRDINYRANVAALRELGCDVVVSISLAGSLVERFDVGDTVIYDDVLDFRKSSTSFFSAQEAKHVAMAPLVCPALETQLRAIAADRALPFGGTMVVMEGPRYSTRAESKMYAALGGELICQTVAPECFLIREMKMCWCGICLVTDRDTRDGQQMVSTGLIFENMKRDEQDFAAHLREILCRIEPFDRAMEDERDAVPTESVAGFPSTSES